VPVGAPDAWSVEPFGAETCGGALYGRGACDMKAGLALQIAIAHALAPHAARLRGTLVLHFAIGEERAEPGTRSLIEAGFGGDLGIVTEPTALTIAMAQRGAAHYRVTVSGESGHAGRARDLRNPIAMLPTVLEIVARHDQQLAARRHALLASPSLTPTIVSAGEAPNTVPGTLTLICDRRLLPAESHDDDVRALRDAFRGAGVDADIEIVGNVFAASESPANSRVAEALKAAYRAEFTAEPTISGTAFASDVRNLINDAGMDAVTFGPGQLEQCHSRDEHISLAEVTAGGRILLRAVEALLS
jgi:succinyl-diaminopimelate desuccinylase